MHETAEAPVDVRHLPSFEVRPSHSALLGPLEVLSAVGDVAGQGIVMVPAARAESALTTGVDLARGLQWPLLVLCSRGVEAPTVRARLRVHDGLGLTAADLMSSSWLRAPRGWSAVQHRAALQRAGIDTNRKRNLALCAARMLGKRWVLFVDDDVTGLALGTVETALTHLAKRQEHRVVGWPHRPFPDNSVVHHARRDVMGWEQDVFIGGGALLVDLTAPPAPFPPVYNEDWLFLFDALAEEQVAAGPAVGQLPYDPYVHPGRAAVEEFGDVLGEGLFHLLHEDLDVGEAMKPRYWRDVLEKRRKLLARITERARELSASGSKPRTMQQVVLAMTEARRQHTWVTEDALADFVRRWRDDQDTWAEFYERLPERATLKDALVYLGLHEAWIVTSGPGH
jgi:hypothetical protein